MRLQMRVGYFVLSGGEEKEETRRFRRLDIVEVSTCDGMRVSSCCSICF